MQRQTRSGLPIRERGARMVPEQVDEEAGAGEMRTDPAAIRDVLSRQLTGVRRGRAETETEAEQPRGEGDR